MINYNFKREFAPQIATGAQAPKVITLRRGRKAPSRHANPGEPVGLWTGLRSKEAKRQGVGIVTLTGLLRFEQSGIRYLSDVRAISTLDAVSEAVEREALDREHDAFARRDGFENYASMWAWHFAHRTDEEKAAAASVIVHHLICWRPLTAEQITALEAGELSLEAVA